MLRLSIGNSADSKWKQNRSLTVCPFALGRGNLLLTLSRRRRCRLAAVLRTCKRTTTTPATNMAKHTILYFDFDFCALTFLTKTHFLSNMARF